MPLLKIYAAIFKDAAYQIAPENIAYKVDPHALTPETWKKVSVCFQNITISSN